MTQIQIQIRPGLFRFAWWIRVRRYLTGVRVFSPLNVQIVLTTPGESWVAASSPTVATVGGKGARRLHRQGSRMHYAFEA